MSPENLHRAACLGAMILCAIACTHLGNAPPVVKRLAWASEPRAARTDQRHGYGLVQCLRRPVLQPRSLLLLSRR